MLAHVLIGFCSFIHLVADMLHLEQYWCINGSTGVMATKWKAHERKLKFLVKQRKSMLADLQKADYSDITEKAIINPSHSPCITSLVLRDCLTGKLMVDSANCLTGTGIHVDSPGLFGVAAIFIIAYPLLSV